jgi:hypothetical protein
MMIGLELALVTAVALFWSTFSSSALLSAGLTFGLFVAGQFGADLKNFEQVVKSPAAGLVGRALYYLLPNFAAFDIKTEVVHALPDPARIPGTDGRIRLCLYRPAADGVGHDFCAKDFK